MVEFNQIVKKTTTTTIKKGVGASCFQLLSAAAAFRGRFLPHELLLIAHAQKHLAA